MITEDQKLLLETSIGLAALIDLLADGEGLASLNDFRRLFHERVAPQLNEAVKRVHAPPPVTAGVHPKSTVVDSPDQTTSGLNP